MPNTIPVAKNTHALVQYSGNHFEKTDGIDDDEIWEQWDGLLTVLIPNDSLKLHELVVRRKYGLMGLVGFFEHLVHNCHLDAGVLDGKIERLM